MPEENEYLYVTREEDLARASSAVERARKIALDTEADSFHHYYEKLCLVQVKAGGKSFILDPLGKLDLKKILRAIESKPLILHAADYDLRMLRMAYDFKPKGDVFDTMLAAQLLGFEQVGLAALVEHYFGVVLPKQKQKSDWSRRPLSEAYLKYASDDTLYLEPMAERMKAELVDKGRLEWHRESCRRTVDAAAEARAKDPENAWRIKGTGKFRSRRELEFARQIWTWREQEAKRADRPPFMIMGNSQLLDLAAWAARQKAGTDFMSPDLALGPEKTETRLIPRNCTGRRLNALREAIRKAAASEPASWPDFRKGKQYTGPDYSPQVEEIRSECARMARELAIDPSVLAPRATIEAIVRNRALTVPDMRANSPILEWQARLIQPAVSRVLQETAE